MLNAREVQFPSKPAVSAEGKEFIRRCAACTACTAGCSARHLSCCTMRLPALLCCASWAPPPQHTAARCRPGCLPPSTPAHPRTCPPAHPQTCPPTHPPARKPAQPPTHPLTGASPTARPTALTCSRPPRRPTSASRRKSGPRRMQLPPPMRHSSSSSSSRAMSSMVGECYRGRPMAQQQQ